MTKKQLLIVEDQLGIINFLKQGLEEEDYVVHVAQNGKTGLDLFKHHKIDLILLDWMMPVMPGLEFCETLRLFDKQTPIIFLTAKDTTEEIIAGLKAGANDYIKKPFSFDELLERIKIHFRQQSTELIMYQNISVNLLKREVYENDLLINLTKKEYDLLVFLMHHMGKICTRDEIINHVWDIHFEYDSGVIDVFINALRKKIVTIKNKNLIKAVRGVGYVFE